MASDYSTKANLREALLDQLTYLMYEVEALRPVVDQVPEELQRLPASGMDLPLSLRETYGLLAAYDTEVVRPILLRMIAEDAPHLDPVGEETLAAEADWNEQPIDVLLERVQQVRQTVLDVLKDLPPAAWDRTATFGGTEHDVYGVAHYVTQHDADLLRDIGYHLEGLMPTRAASKA